MPAQRHVTLTFLTLAALVAAGCTSPESDGARLDTPMVGGDDVVVPESVTGSTGGVGGSVKNSAPTVPTFTPSATTGENRGSFAVVFTGTIRDANTENQIQNVSVRGTGPSPLASAVHVITAAEKAALTEPETFGSDGFKVWTGTANDGILNFKYQLLFPAFHPAGAYSFTARAYDTPGAVATSGAVAVTLVAFSDITISATPVDASGAPLTGQNWGHWEAEAGATNVASSNYIRLVNTGDVAGSSVVIDFASQFVGASDPNFTIPVASNVQFAWFEDTTPSTTAPSEGTFTYGTANSEGTVTVNFSGQNNVIYVTYRIVQLPEILPVQSYGIAYTVTEL